MEPVFTLLTLNYLPFLNFLLLVLILEWVDNVSFARGMIVEVILYFLSKLKGRQIIVLQNLYKVLDFDVFILFKGFLCEVDQLLLPFTFFLILLQQRAPFLFVEKFEQLFDFFLVVWLLNKLLSSCIKHIKLSTLFTEFFLISLSNYSLMQYLFLKKALIVCHFVSFLLSLIYVLLMQSRHLIEEKSWITNLI